MTLSHFFPIGFTALLDFKTSKPMICTQLTCLIFTHMLDDYCKSLDPVFDVLRIEKPFDYFFRRFDVVSLVVLKELVNHDQFPIGASTRDRQRTYVSRTWSWKYFRKTTSKLQESFYPKFSFTKFYMFFRFFLRDSFSFDTGKMDLRSNPFQEGENDTPLGSALGKTDMHGLIMGSNKDICSLFDTYIQNHEASTHEITWKMF